MGYVFEDITDPSYEMTIQDGAFVNANIKEVCIPACECSKMRIIRMCLGWMQAI